MNAFIKADRVNNSDDLNSCVKKRFSQCKSKDPLFDVEAAVLNLLSGKAAECRVRQMLMQALPTKEAGRNETDAFQLIRAHISTSGFKFLPGSLQNIMKFIIIMVAAVDGETSKTLQLGKMTALTAECWRRMKFFCRYVGSYDGKAEPKEWTGDEAIHAMLYRVHKKVKKADENDITKELAAIKKYRWVASDEDAARVAALCEDEGDGEAAGAGGPAPKAKAKAKAKAKLVKSDDAMAAALAVFNK